MPQKVDRREARSERGLALPIATGLALFLGGNLVLLLPGTTTVDGTSFRTWAFAVSWVVRFGGAFVVVFCSFRLARRPRTDVAATTEDVAEAGRSAAGRLRRSRAFVVVTVGLVLMAAAELPAVLYPVGDASYSSNPFDVVVLAFAAVGTYLGPVLTAAGAYLALRRLEDATAPRRPAPSTPAPEA